MKKTGDAAREIHLAEVAWVVAWLSLGALVLVGLNSSFGIGAGEINTWQLVFGFLGR